VILSTIAVLAAVAPPAPARVAHTVEPGETLWSIALANNLTTPLLAAANDLPPTAHILAGNTISVPSVSEPATARAEQVQPGAPLAGGARGYVVRPGDSLSAIAARSGVTVGELASLNGLDPAGTLLIGTRLKLPTGAPVASPAAAVRPRPQWQQGVEPISDRVEHDDEAVTNHPPIVDPHGSALVGSFLVCFQSRCAVEVLRGHARDDR
jgi:LysM repeat protein